MSTGYKEPHAFKGFEQWLHALRMTIKMHLYTFFVLLTLHLAIPILYIMFLYPQEIGFLFRAFFSFQFQYILLILKHFVELAWFVFVLAIPMWLLYPLIIKAFKIKSKKIIQDEHLRGTKLIVDRELVKMIKQEIKEKRGIYECEFK